jgi:hypothetical protein
MRSRRGTRLAIAVLTGTTGILAVLNINLLQGTVDISPLAPPAGRDELWPRQAQDPVTALDKRTAEQLAETVSRPLFHPSRRPVQRAEAATPEPKAEPPGKLRVVGIVRVADQPPRALIRFADEAIGKWLAEGAEFKGWRLRKVNERSVVVESGRRTHELTLPTVRNAARAASARERAPPSGQAEGD